MASDLCIDWLRHSFWDASSVQNNSMHFTRSLPSYFALLPPKILGILGCAYLRWYIYIYFPSRITCFSCFLWWASDFLPRLKFKKLKWDGRVHKTLVFTVIRQVSHLKDVAEEIDICMFFCFFLFYFFYMWYNPTVFIFISSLLCLVGDAPQETATPAWLFRARMLSKATILKSWNHERNRERFQRLRLRPRKFSTIIC